MTDEELSNRSDYAAIGALARRTAEALDDQLPAGREKSLVFTKLEEMQFWAHAAIARRDQRDG